MAVKPTDFKSVASTNFATGAAVRAASVRYQPAVMGHLPGSCCSVATTVDLPSIGSAIPSTTAETAANTY